MKILRVFLIVSVIMAALLFTAGIIFLKTFDANRILPQVTSQVAKILGRDFTVGSAVFSFSLGQGIVLEARDIVLADDPLFSDKPFLSVRRIQFGVDLAGLVLRQKLRMTRIIIDSPDVLIIRSKNGSINAASLAKGGAEPSPSDKKAAAVPVFFINTLRISDARITYIDESLSPSLRIAIDHIDVNMDDFSLFAQFPVTVKAAVFSSKQNLEGSFKVRADLSKQIVHLEGMEAGIDLAGIDVARLQEDFSALKPLALQKMSGRLKVLASAIQAGGSGLSELKMQVFLEKGVLLSGLMRLPLEDVDCRVDVNEKQLDITSLTAKVANGALKVNGLVVDYLTMPVAGATVSLENLDIKRFSDAFGLPVRVSGLLSGSSDFKFSGKEPQQIVDSFSGKARVDLKDGVLENINLLALGLGKIPLLSGLMNSVQEELPPRTKEEVEKGITRINICRAQATFIERVAVIDTAELVTGDMQVNAKGTIGLEEGFDMSADVYMAQPLSQKLKSAANDLAALENDKGQLYFPVNVNGPLMKPRVLPDIGYLTQRIVAARGGDALQKVLGTPEAAQAVNAIFDLFRK